MPEHSDLDFRSQGSLRAEMTPDRRHKPLEEARKTNTCPGLVQECCKENHGRQSRTTIPVFAALAGLDISMNPKVANARIVWFFIFISLLFVWSYEDRVVFKLQLPTF